MSHMKKAMKSSVRATPQLEDQGEQSRRNIILKAAGKVFLERGFDAATTLDIAGQAKMSKRTLYEHFPSKEAMLTALIESGSKRMSTPLRPQLPATYDEFLAALHDFGLSFLRELIDPYSIAMYRLAIAEAQRSGHVAKELYRSGREPVVQAALAILQHGARQGFCKSGDIELLLTTFFNVLVGPLQMGLLLGTEPPPTDDLLHKRADFAIHVIAKLTQ